ncbi:hypothetical protein BDV98DRAFT_120238 [Pterulicium gracile]|uniref:Uncharacterized protein n=1 Tax=Pterulicium gracile TaxID=1884261 RepID=A0A5C3QF25_9AGAR|nr:hypothetical protein BDV98DRAFT_120238 [Pterula gracilis]
MPQRPPFSAIYSQALYSPDYGFPLFRPNPLVIRNLGTGLSTRDEVQIGTVGYITREGFFRTIGNVSSIINLEEMGLDVQDTPEFFIQPSVDKPAIYNTTGHRRSFNMTLCTGENIAFTALGFGAGFQVDLASASVKGGFLALPEGAYLQKLDNEVMLEEAFYSDDGRAQLLSWLEALEARVGEGPISIITEHIKCKSWGTAAVYDERHSFSGQLIFQAMGAEASVGGSFAPYMWHCSQSSSMVANANRSSEDRGDQLFIFGDSASRSNGLEEYSVSSAVSNRE